MFLPDHGGAVRLAAQHYGIPVARWLDLSTGINPHHWPVATIPHDIWKRLPQDDASVSQAAREYYGAAHCVAVPGSQSAIQLIPRMVLAAMDRPAETVQVAVLQPSYAEHAKVWRRQGCRVVGVSPQDMEGQLAHCQVLVVVNPNNPTGHVFPPATLIKWQERLAEKGGMLIVDEAFMDCCPEHSVAQYAQRPGLLVLRSFGKFFGLAGLRLGFVLADETLCSEIYGELGPWAVSYPAQYLAGLALRDTKWQEKMRKNLHASWTRLGIMLSQKGLAVETAPGSSLFHWTRHTQADEIHDQMARQGVLLRLFAEPKSLRIGLPGNEQEWQRLEASLDKLSIEPCVA